MKKILFLAIPLTGLILLLSLCSGPEDTALREKFQNPPLEFRMNQNLHGFPLDEAGQDSLIKAYLENGYGGFTINVPYQEYLIEKGMTATLSFAEKAKAAGMELWLYDEHGYPSGNAGDPATGEIIQVSNNPDIVLKPYHGKIYRTN